ncbi:MAG: penicillin acylase family protein [Candidatus Dormibacteria bacterium]
MPEVTIHRDQWGVAHVYSVDETSGFYGVGWAQAGSQLELLLRHQLAVCGRLAEHFGRTFLPSDVMARRWMHAEESRDGLSRLPSQLQENYRAFVAGVQDFMRANPARVPGWAPVVEEWLPLAVMRHFLWGYMIGDAMAAMERAGIPLPADVEAEAAAAGAPRASNEWVLLPERTADGHSILLSDPHGDIEGLQMFECVIEAGPIKSAGVMAIGCALPFLGFTRDVAWGMTTGAPSVSDCYSVEVHPEDPRRYRFDGTWKAMTVRREIVKVKDDEPFVVENEYTDHNGLPSAVVARHEGHAYVVSTPYIGVPELLDAEIYGWHRARDVGEFREAMRSCGMFAQNIMATDSSGMACYVRAGRVPVRAPGVDWKLPIDGGTSATAWAGIHKLDELVHIEDPTCGYMSCNNVSPDRMIPDPEGTTLEASAYPDYIFNDRPGRSNSRGVRSTELLAGCASATDDDALAIALDLKWVDADAWINALSTALKAQPPGGEGWSEAQMEFAHGLLAFDGQARADSVLALNFLYWRSEVAQLDVALPLAQKVVTGGGLNPGEQTELLAAARRACDLALDLHGRSDVAYGEVHRIGRGGRSWPCGGGPILLEPLNPVITSLPEVMWDRGELMVAPLRVMIFGEADEHGQKHAVLGGRSLRMTVMANPPRSYSVVLFGQSGDPESPNYTDQAELVGASRTRRLAFEWAELEPQVVSTTVLNGGRLSFGDLNV